MLRCHHAAADRSPTPRQRMSVVAAAYRAVGHGRRRESRAIGTVAAMRAGTPLVTRAVVRRAGVSGVGPTRRRTVRGAEAVVASRRRVAVSRAPRAAHRATTVAAAVGALVVATPAGMAAVAGRAASHGVARRRTTADRKVSRLPLAPADIRWSSEGIR